MHKGNQSYSLCENNKTTDVYSVFGSSGKVSLVLAVFIALCKIEIPKILNPTLSISSVKPHEGATGVAYSGGLLKLCYLLFVGFIHGKKSSKKGKKRITPLMTVFFNTLNTDTSGV